MILEASLDNVELRLPSSIGASCIKNFSDSLSHINSDNVLSLSTSSTCGLDVPKKNLAESSALLSIKGK